MLAFFLLHPRTFQTRYSCCNFSFLENGIGVKRKKHLGKEMLFVEVASGFEPLYEVLQTSA